MKQQVEQLRSLLDSLFTSINNTQIARGTGLMFTYKNDIIKKDDDNEEWHFTVYVSEPGYNSRALQTIPFHREKSDDRYRVEYQVLMTVLAIMAETSLLQWNEIGKMLNTDKELQNSAKEILKK